MLLPLFSARQPWEGHVVLGVGNICPRGRVRSDQGGRELPAHVKTSNTFSQEGWPWRGAAGSPNRPASGLRRIQEGGPSVYPPSTSEITSPTGAPASFYPWRTSREPGPLCTRLKWNKFCSPDDGWSGDTPSWRSLPRRRSPRS